MVVFISSYSGKAKTTGNDYQRVTLQEIRRSAKTEEVVSKTVDFFVNNLNVEGLKCGDVVKPEFEEPEILGGNPELVGLEKLEDNIFEDLV